MKIKIFMMTAGHNSEREVLRCMHDGIEKEYLPTEKEDIKKLKSFNKAHGEGTGVEYSYDERYSNCDFAVMLGSWKNRDQIHHNIRNSIKQRAKMFFCIETPLLGRKVFQPNDYYRVGLNGFLNKDAYFGSARNWGPERFNQLGLKYEGWKKNRGNKIVIALQLAGDASLRNNDINEWCIDSIRKLRKYTDRPIEIRTHPGVSDKGIGNHEGLFKAFAFEPELSKNVTFVNGREIEWEKQILDAYAVVSYTSGLSIDAVLNGVPVIACDEGNFAWNISETKLENIEKMHIPQEDIVRQWLYNLSYCQWTPDEMSRGLVWRHFLPEIERRLEEIRQERQERINNEGS